MCLNVTKSWEGRVEKNKPVKEKKWISYRIKINQKEYISTDLLPL
jgi:hypothetical protein